MPQSRAPHANRELLGWIDEFLRERLGRGDIGLTSAFGYQQRLWRFAADFGGRPLTELDGGVVDRWLAQQVSRFAPTTRRTDLVALRLFARWLLATQRLDQDITANALRVPRRRRTYRSFTNEDIYTMLRVARTSRDRLVVWLMFGCGLSVREVTGIDVADFDHDNRYVVVINQQGAQRRVPVPVPVRVELATYLQNRAFHPGFGQLVRGVRNTEPLDSRSVSALVLRLIRRAGLKQRPQDGRDARGVRLAAGADLFDTCLDAALVKEFLGHETFGCMDAYRLRRTIAEVQQANDARFTIAS